MNIENDNIGVNFIFPTAIYTAKPVNKNQYIETIINNISKYQFDSTDTNGSYLVLSGEYAGKSNMHHDPALEDFYKMIVTHAKSYVDVLGIRENLFDYYINKSWLSVIDGPEHHMQYHIHSNADISFVYYVQVPENSDALSFLNTNKPNELFAGMFDTPAGADTNKNFFKERNPTNFTSWYFNPVPGMLFMFPGSKLQHGTVPSPERTQPPVGKRIAVAGDISIVLKPEYSGTGFESGRTSLNFMKKYDI